MKNRVALNMSWTRPGVLAVAMAALAGTICFGITNVKASEAQSQNAGVVASRQATQGPVGEYRISKISVTGVKAPQVNESIRSLLGMEIGDIYDDTRLRKAFENMRKAYGSLGYVNFMPDPYFDFDDARKVVVLTININEGRQYFVNRIRFTGNTSTRDDVIRRDVLLKEGEVFNSSLLGDTLVRLNRLGMFEEIKPEDARITFISNEPKLDIEIRVREKTR